MNLYKDFEYFNTPIKVVAHRGDSKYYPENSMVAFKSAIELGVDIIETDVHMSSDGVIFIWHDETTEKLDGNKTHVTKRKWSELEKLDLGFLYIDKNGKRPFSSTGIRLMKFQEALKTFPNIKFNVDLKDKKPKLVRDMYEILKKENAFNRVVIASFHTENLKRMRKLSPKVTTSYGVTEVLLLVILSKIGLLRLISNFLILSPVLQVPVSAKGLRVITSKFIKILHKRGVKVQVWTINNRDEMTTLYKLGVDGVMTDDPRLLLEVVNNHSINVDK